MPKPKSNPHAALVAIEKVLTLLRSVQTMPLNRCPPLVSPKHFNSFLGFHPASATIQP
jgi:hypothetical protein